MCTWRWKAQALLLTKNRMGSNKRSHFYQKGNLHVLDITHGYLRGGGERELELFLNAWCSTAPPIA